MTERERELQSQIDALQKNRRDEDLEWRREMRADQKEQIQKLDGIKETADQTKSDVGQIKKRLVAGDDRMTKQDAEIERIKKEQIATAARMQRLEHEAKFRRRLETWVIGILTTLGLGWIVKKLGWDKL